MRKTTECWISYVDSGVIYHPHSVTVWSLYVMTEFRIYKENLFETVWRIFESLLTSRLFWVQNVNWSPLATGGECLRALLTVLVRDHGNFLVPSLSPRQSFQSVGRKRQESCHDGVATLPTVRPLSRIARYFRICASARVVECCRYVLESTAPFKIKQHICQLIGRWGEIKHARYFSGRHAATETFSSPLSSYEILIEG